MINDHMKTNLNFSQTNLTSLEGLAKYIDPSQLTIDLEGSLAYDHSIWIEMRCVSVILYLWSVFMFGLNSVSSADLEEKWKANMLGHFAQTQCLKKVIACNYVQGQKVRGLSSEIVVL